MAGQGAGTMPCPGMGTMAGPGAGMMAGGGAQGGMMSSDMMAMMQTMHPTVAVDDTAIYIVRGSQLLKYDKQTLQLISQITLPASTMTMPSGTSVGGPGRGPMQGTTMQVSPQMQQMMSQMQQMTPLQFDRSFLQNMTDHHEGAIAASRLAVQKAQHPELRRFAQKVINDQSSEIRQFNTWLNLWYGAPVRPQLMPMDQDEVNKLQNLSGRDFEIEYMRHMIMHHSDGIAMAQMAQQKASHPQVVQAASNIIQKQTMEINQLRTWLNTWYGIQG